MRLGKLASPAPRPMSPVVKYIRGERHQPSVISRNPGFIKSQFPPHENYSNSTENKYGLLHPDLNPSLARQDAFRREWSAGDKNLEPTLMVVGLNYRTAPVAVRERFWISENRRYEALVQLSEGGRHRRSHCNGHLQPH